MHLIDIDLKEPQVIVVAPTRELAQQLYQATQHLAQFKSNVKVSLFIGELTLKKTNNVRIYNHNSSLVHLHGLMI